MVYEGKEFSSKFPYLRMGNTGAGCLDPTAGVIMADKAVRAVQVVIVIFAVILEISFFKNKFMNINASRAWL